MKVLKIISITAAVILVLLAAGIGFMVSKFDAAQIKTQITQLVKDKKQRTLTIEGDLQLSFWPNIGLSLGRTSLSEKNSAQTFAVMQSVRLAVAVMPLLDKRIEVKEIRLQGAQATLIRGKDGRLNIDDLLSQDPQDKEKSTPLTMTIADGIKVNDTELTWRDEQGGTTAVLSKLNLASGRIFADTGLGRYEVGNLKLSTQLELRPSSGNRIQVNKLEVLASALAADGQASVLTVNDFNLEGEGQLGAGDKFGLTVQAPKLALNPQGSASSKVLLSARLAAAKQDVDAKFEFSGIEGNAKAIKVAGLLLNLKLNSGDTAIKGEMKSPMQLDLQKQVLSLAKLEGNLEIDHPKMPMKKVKLPLTGQLTANLLASSASGKLATQFDESKINLAVEVSKFTPLALGFDLDVDQFDVDKYFPPEAASPAAAAAGKAPNNEASQAKSGTEAKIDLSALNGLNVYGTAKIGKLKVSNIKMSQLKLQMKLANGKLEISPHSANLYQGSMVGALSLDAKTNAISVRENLVGIDINPLLQDIANKDVLAGRGSVALEISTRGETLTAWKKALSGTADLRLAEGAVKGINLAKQFRDIKAKISNKQTSVQAADAAEKTDFSELSASFKINNGVAHNEDLMAKSPFLRLGGSGDIDIGNSRLNYLAKATIVGTSSGQGGKELSDVKGLTVPVRLAGTFEAPTWNIEYGNMLADLAQGKIDEKKAEVRAQVTEKIEAKKTELKDKAVGQVQDKLKGLFGR